MTVDIYALANQAAESGPDMNEGGTGGGGGDYTPPAAGIARCRLVGYIETGKHEKSVGAGKPKVNKEQVELVFELSGPNHAPTVGDDGTVYPHRVTESFNAAPNYGQLNEKSGLFKLFRRMNHDGKATHMSQLLGKPFLCTVYHTKRKIGDKEFTFVNLRDADGVYSLSPPSFTNPGTGVVEQIEVAPAVSQLRLFVWNTKSDEALKAMWDTLFIDGEYPERKDKNGVVTAAAKSKNVLQNKVKSANNFAGSPIANLLIAKGVPLNLGAEQSADPLADPLVAEAPSAGSADAGAAQAATQSAAPTGTASATVAAPVDGGGDPLAAF